MYKYFVADNILYDVTNVGNVNHAINQFGLEPINLNDKIVERIILSLAPIELMVMKKNTILEEENKTISKTKYTKTTKKEEHQKRIVYHDRQIRRVI